MKFCISNDVLKHLQSYLLTLSLISGDSCSANGFIGECRFLTECAAAIDNIKRGVLPQICGFVGSQSIVCCTNSITKPLKTTTTTQKTTTPRKSITTVTSRHTEKRKTGEISKQSEIFSKIIF